MAAARESTTEKDITIKDDVPKADLEKEYLSCLEYMRGVVQGVEDGAESTKRKFYKSATDSVEECEIYLKGINEVFLQANNHLRNNNIRLEAIDGELTFISMMHNLRTFSLYPEGVNELSAFWKRLKAATQQVLPLLQKFRKTVITRLQNNCVSYYNKERSGIKIDVSDKYSDETQQYLVDIDLLSTNLQILLKSFTSGVHQDLFTDANLSKRILVLCDIKAFPVLRLFPDLMEKLSQLFQISRRWLERDETYVREINRHIRETRNKTNRKAQDLRANLDKHKRVEKSVKAAYILCQNNKQKLQRLEKDLSSLDDQIHNQRQVKDCKHIEKQQKESMADFLEITMTQTRKNYTLQLKRSRLLRQVRELEQYLGDIEQELSSLQDQISKKAQEKMVMKDKVEVARESYVSLKRELDRFSSNLTRIQQEVTKFSGQLLELEIIQTFKTSPEKLDDVYDRPSSVKIAPSLRDKIRRKRKMLAQNQTL